MTKTATMTTTTSVSHLHTRMKRHTMYVPSKSYDSAFKRRQQPCEFARDVLGVLTVVVVVVRWLVVF